MRPTIFAVILITISTAAQATVPVGTIALYSDGRVEKLVAIENDGLRWEDDRMRQFLRSRNPIVPVLESRQLITGKTYTQLLDSGNPDSINQVPEGTPIRFSMTRFRDGEEKTRYWKCEYLGSSVNEVLGVARELDRYRCQKSTWSSGKFPRFTVRDTRDFTFSPELGVMVQMRRETAKRTRSRKLVALYEPGSIDHKTLSREVRKLRQK